MVQRNGATVECGDSEGAVPGTVPSSFVLLGALLLGGAQREASWKCSGNDRVEMDSERIGWTSLESPIKELE